MTVILQCPVCKDRLLNSADGYKCVKHHTFDVAREGYVNLLLVHKKNSKEPGDSPDMVLGRRRFLDLGHYNRVSDGINAAIGELLSTMQPDESYRILDAGCGEGFYLKRLKEALAAGQGSRTAIDYYGVDISKFAVRQATKRDKSIDWFVASIKELPFAATAFDGILSVFSPVNVEEFSRVLRERGLLVAVTPGPRHLNGLREIIYPEAREHRESSLPDQAKGLFTLEAATRVNYPIELSTGAEIMDLLGMTPYFWNIDLNTKAKVEKLGRLGMDVDVNISVFRKAGSAVGQQGNVVK